MMVRLLLGVAFVAYILVLVVCTESAQATSTSVSSASATSSSYSASSSSSTKAVVKSKSDKCRKVKKCPKNEEFSYCPESIQRAQYCSEKAEPSTYNRSSADKPCEEGCVCKENYLRAENGTCILANQCPITCGTNEVLDNCPTDLQSDYCPTEEDTEVKPCVMSDVCPPPVCKCAFNHRRASNGSCIPTKECPPFKCKTNEEYNPCPPLCPTDDCSQASPTGECPPQFGHIGIVLPCNPKCRCIEDYWRLDGICVPYGQCPGVCPDNERYSTCVQAECRALNCTQKDRSTFCEKGCVCEEGYLRNKDGICVLEEKCEPVPSCNSDNEEFVSCMQGVCRAKDCSQKGEDVPCPDIPAEECESGCICKEYYLRAANGTCVPEDQCETEVCPDNERYSGCIQAECRALNCTQKDQSVPCIRLDPTFCEKGCVCEEGYLRNKDGICVSEDKCEPLTPSCDSANEEFVLCMQGVCRAKDCSQKGEDVPCPDIPAEECDSGCICKEYYLRAANGTCVPEDQCETEVCPDNERYSGCIQAECRALNCTQKDQSVPCIRLDPTFCEKGCVCEEGYLRNKDGICVSEDKCEPLTPSCDSANEEFVLCMQGVCRAKDCSQKGEDVPCPDIPAEECDSGCICKEYYLRAANGTCVPEDQCETEVCPDNERYSGCIQAECRALNCTQKDQSVPCIRLDPTFCEKGCVCEEGYLRNKDGICVSEDKCEPPSCNSDKEEFVPCMQGVCRAKDCSQKGEDVPCPDIPAEECDSGCICKEYYLRAANGTCVPEDQCETEVCPDNERYSGCIQAECRALNCTQKDQSVPCIRLDPTFCEKGCVCEEGYLRNKDGICVSEDKCEPSSCNSDNEEFVPCMQGVCRAKDCSQKGEDVPCPDIPAEECDSGCICKEYYLRAPNGTCVPEDQCETEVCPDNERYSGCIQAECRALSCTQKDQSVPCIRLDPTFCEKGCVCEEGYLRNKDGICVSEDKCEPPSCPLNEEWSTCAQATCRPQKCSEKGETVSCPLIAEGYCEEACVCQENFLRNENGDCVPEDECPPKTCGENEVLDNCSLTCNSDNCPQSADEEQVCTQSDPCVPACKCEFNYKRAENGTCIPTRDCPPFNCSAKPNEEFVACPPFCPTDECGKPRLEGRCPFRIGTFLQCNPKCQCMDGYGRSNGTCVPFEECPDLCPVNETYSPCVQQTCRPQNCSDRDLAMKTYPTSDAASCQRGCVCQENYYRNDTGVCVSYEECGGHICPLNEEWSICAQATCRPQNCSEKGETVPCPLIAEGYCEEACVCQENFLRNENGDCVPEDECPPKTCGEHEVLDNCSLTCNSDNCPQSADEEQVCTQSDPCVPACKCEFNYKRAENGTCIPTRDCPPFNCSAKPNEEFVACPPFCPTDECGKPRLEGRCPFRIGTFLQCNPKCQCMDGYGRSNGTCVPFEECPDLCPANEVYSPCVQQTCRPQNCSDRDLAMKTCPTSDAASCQRGCVCRENYYRNDTGFCVSYEECGGPITCGENEFLDDCPMKCNSDNCPKSADEEQVCTRADPCVTACKCRFNYKRAENGTCIPTRDCPPFDCSAKPNEKFVACPPICPTDECGYPRLEGRCPFRIGIILQCKPKCQCMDGYGRSNGTCVPFEECPDLCPTNEVYSSCMQQTCRPQNCSDRDLAVESCPTSDAASCQRGCVCQENYYRNDKGVCVSYEECGGPITCGENEFLDDCPMKCNSDNCPKSADEEQVCTQADPCVPACKCRFNYKRAENGTCIPTRDCPPFDCSAKPNEKFVACPPICPTDECGYPRLEGRCPFRIGIILQCKPKCQCMDGYGRSNGTCVPFEECPDLCPANEVYSPCMQQTCRPQNCSDRDLAMESCPTSDAASCQRGCVCQENYYRNDKGVCISYEECGGPMCPNAHEVYTPYFKECPPNICESLVARYKCDEKQKEGPGCICESGYLRESLESSCIPICDCPEMKNSPDC